MYVSKERGEIRSCAQFQTYEVHTNGRDEGLCESVVGKTEKEGRLSYSRITNEEELEEVVTGKTEKHVKHGVVRQYLKPRLKDSVVQAMQQLRRPSRVLFGVGSAGASRGLLGRLIHGHSRVSCIA